MKKYKNEQWLIERYHSDNLSQREISELCDCSRKTIGRWMNKFNIETRDQSKSSLISQCNCSGKHRNKNWLNKVYTKQENNLKEVAQKCGCNHETIRSWLKRKNIDRRDSSKKVNNKCKGKHKDKIWLEKMSNTGKNLKSISEKCGCSASTICKWMNKFDIHNDASLPNCSLKHKNNEWIKEEFLNKKNSVQKMSQECGCSNSVIYRRINELNLERDDITTNCNLKHKNKNWLKKKYAEEGKTMKEMAEICGCIQGNISNWINKYDIETRTDGKFKSGEDHWNFNHGNKTKEKLDFRKSKKWKKFSIDKKKSANWKCEYCGNNGRLHTHHVNPISMGGSKWDNKFIVLCRECHIDNYDKWHPPELEEYISS